MLGDQERQDMRDEILADLGRLVKSLLPSPKPPPDRRYQWLNCPFAVTVMGGLAIALVTSCVQHRSASLERKRACERELYDRKQKILTEFADGFVRSANLALRFKKRSLWIRWQQHEDPKRAFSDGRSYAETTAYHAKLLDEYLTARNTDSLCAQVRAVFSDPDTVAKAEQLDAVMDKLMLVSLETGSTGEYSAESVRTAFGRVSDAYGQTQDLFEDLIIAMERELRSQCTGY